MLAICNTNGATIPRESDAVLYTAGPEIAVASTKAFLTQIVAVYLMALYLAQVRGQVRRRDHGRHRPAMADAGKGDAVLETTEPVRASPGRCRCSLGAVPRPARGLSGRARRRAC